MKRSTWLPPVVFTAIVLVLWEVGVRLFHVSEQLLPPPSDVAGVLVAKWAQYARHSVPTLYEIVVGYAIALVLGAGCGMIIAFSPVLGNAIYPLLVAVQIMPKVAFAPLLVVWFGFGFLPKLVLIALIAFFPIVLSTVVALNMTSQETINLFRSMGASPSQTFFKLRLPNALPVFFSGLKVAVTLSVVGVIVAEFYSSSQGLGYLMLLDVSGGNTAAAFAAIVVVTVLGMLLFGAVSLLERRLIPPHMLKRFDDPGALKAAP
jgi:NitT/TauT family transport system permease protein